MALAKITRPNFGRIYGKPVSDTEWDEVDFDNGFNNYKFIITGDTLEVSFDKKEVHMALRVGSHDFKNLNISKFFLRKKLAEVEIYGFGVE